MSSFGDDWFKRFKERKGFFFPELDKMIEEIEKEMAKSFKDMENVMPRDMVRVRRLPDGSVRREYGPFVYGYSMKIGPDGKPVIREFGNIKPGAGVKGQPLNLREQREPLIDVIEEEGEIKVLAELPGVDKKDINLFLTEGTLTISVDTAGRKYFKELDLPVDVDETSARSTFSNGVLETTLIKSQPKGKGKQLSIE
ncbi:Hsp20 family protein [archaeon]|nr:Hsp20 family protein [archaeon]